MRYAQGVSIISLCLLFSIGNANDIGDQNIQRDYRSRQVRDLSISAKENLEKDDDFDLWKSGCDIGFDIQDPSILLLGISHKNMEVRLYSIELLKISHIRVRTGVAISALSRNEMWRNEIVDRDLRNAQSKFNMYFLYILSDLLEEKIIMDVKDINRIQNSKERSIWRKKLLEKFEKHKQTVENTDDQTP